MKCDTLHQIKKLLQYTEQKKKFTCIFNVSFLWTEMTLCNFYFMSKYKKKNIQSSENEYHDKSLKLKSTDQFDSRRGQNLKIPFQGAL